MGRSKKGLSMFGTDEPPTAVGVSGQPDFLGGLLLRHNGTRIIPTAAVAYKGTTSKRIVNADAEFRSGQPHLDAAIPKPSDLDVDFAAVNLLKFNGQRHLIEHSHRSLASPAPLVPLSTAWVHTFFVCEPFPIRLRKVGFPVPIFFDDCGQSD